MGLFWRDALGWTLVWDEDGQTAVQSTFGGTKIAWDSWNGSDAGSGASRNRQRFDLVSDDLADDVERLVSLGATREDVLPDGVQLVDPGGNPFRVRSDRRQPIHGGTAGPVGRRRQLPLGDDRRPHDGSSRQPVAR